MSLLFALTIVLVAMAAFNLISFGYGWYAVTKETNAKTGQEMYNANKIAVYASAASQIVTLAAAIAVAWVANAKNRAGGTFR